MQSKQQSKHEHEVMFPAGFFVGIQICVAIGCFQPKAFYLLHFLLDKDCISI